jgi:hypothetical protein
MRLSLKVTLSSVLLFAVIEPGLSAAQTLRNGNTETIPQAVQSLALQAGDVTPLTNGMSRQAAARAANAAPAALHERFATFLADRGFQSYLVLQNLRLDAPVTVTPVLVLGKGEIPLDPINMPPHTTTTVDINDALLAHGVTDTRGAVVARYSFNTYGALSAVVESADPTHRVFLTSVGQSPEEFWYGTTLDAVVWAPEEGTEGFISMINTSAAPKSVQITFFANGRSQETQEIEIASRQHRILKIDSLVKRSHEAGAGIRLAFTGKPGDIVAEGALLKKQTGFSKYIHFADTALHFPSNSLRTNFLLLGRQPLADGFPAQTSFRAVAVLRNVDPVPVQVTPVVKRLAEGSPEISLKPITLAAGETRTIDFSREQRAGNLPGDFNQGTLKLVPDTDHNSIVAELLNFNEASRGYVVGSSFSAHPSRVTGSIWRIDGSFQTTVVVENTAKQADQMTLKLFSDNDTYEKTFTIPGGSLIKINVKDLQQSRIPDKNGKFLLATSGTLSLSGGNGAHSALAFDKLVHSADESEYVGLLANPCNYVTGIAMFFDSTSDQYSFAGFVDAFWTDGSITEDGAFGMVSSNNSLASVSGNIVTVHPVDGSSHNVNLSITELETACDICSADNFFGSGQVTVPQRPACPTSVTLSGTTTFSLASQFPSLKTGIGIVASMQTNPTTTNWNGTQITEALTTVSNNCPQSFGAFCTGSSTFTVGAGGSEFGQNFAPTQNIFYDKHFSTGAVSALDTAGIDSCAASCTQSYSCGGHVIGSFTVNRSFTKGTIQNTPVTNVAVTKQ